jgi:hypothetical protein
VSKPKRPVWRTAVEGNAALTKRIRELAFEEEKWMRLGGRSWTEFVRRCEYELGIPWSEIRERFNRVLTTEPDTAGGLCRLLNKIRKD